MFGVYLESFQFHGCVGAMMRLWSILELMDEESRNYLKNQRSEPRFRRGVDQHLFLSVAYYPRE